MRRQYEPLSPPRREVIPLKPTYRPRAKVWQPNDGLLHTVLIAGSKTASASSCFEVIMENSKIGWTDHTMNFWWGCDKVSPACLFCYIGPIMRRSGNEPFDGPMRTSPENWRKALRWNQLAIEMDERFRVFTCSMSDFFHDGADEWREEAWSLIRECSHLDWLILTKRPELIADRLPKDWHDGYLNVWLGTTVESAAFLSRIDLLSQIPAALRFVSAEPLLGPIDFTSRMHAIDWIITGCENAAREKRRPMDLGWVRDIRDQCAAAGKAHFLKQYYEGTNLMHDGMLDGLVCQAWPASPAEAAFA